MNIEATEVDVVPGIQQVGSSQTVEGLNLPREHNFWQILTTNGTFVLSTEHSHPGAALVTDGMLAHADAVDVNILVAHHAGITVKAIIASGHPCDRN